MASYALLDQHEEDALHKERLLNVEEKPFKRITKRLLTPNSLISTVPTFLPTPPPDQAAADDEAEAKRQKQLEEWRQFREDVTLDFAAFESSIVRIQFLRTSNGKERERYAAEKSRIQATAQAVKNNTAELRHQLEEAQRTLALKKTYDDLAEKITGNRLLKPREDQQASLEKLHAEIANLERESKEYAQTWSERREQFGRIVEEGMQLRRLIRDEKEEVERREGMEEGDDAEDGEAGSKGPASGFGTPRPDADGLTPSQPSQEDGGATPGYLQVQRPSGPGGASPLRQSANAGGSEAMVEDTKMIDEGEADDSKGADEGELEEGEEVSDYTGDKMEMDA